MKEYWFTEDGSKVVRRLAEIHDNWHKWSSNPIMQAWSRNAAAYYSCVADNSTWDTSLSYEGEQGELVKMQIPEARSLARQFIALATKQKLSFQAVAQRTGSDVIQDTRLGNAVAAQVVESQRLDQKGERLAELAYILGIAFLQTTWRTDKGRPHAVSDVGELVYDGDLDIAVRGPGSVFWDYTIEEWDDLDWCEVKVPRNRWSLIAQFPDLSEEIMSLPAISRDSRSDQDTVNALNQDMVYVYEAYHKPTPAIPQGRMLMYSDDQTIYFDGANRYGCIPIEPMKPEPIIGTGLGYPIFSNLLPAQEMMDHSFSAWATNEAAHAVKNVTVPRGAAISVEEIQGMNWISFTPTNATGGGRPEVLDLNKTSNETMKLGDVLRDRQVGLSNLNSALRGQPPAGVTSGAAIATLTTNALEFMTSFQKSYAGCLERTMMHAFNAYQQFCELPHIVDIVGKSLQSYAKEFIGKDLKSIRGFKLSLSNPAMMTVAGRADIADKAMKTGLVKNMQEYFSILEGAPVTELYKTELAENDLICSENNDLLDGTPVRAMAGDNHPMHAREHHAIMNDPELRRKAAAGDGEAAKILENTTNHILEHIDLAKNTDPFFLAMVQTGKMPEQGPPPPNGEAPGEISGMNPEQQAAGPAQPAQDELARG